MGTLDIAYRRCCMCRHLHAHLQQQSMIGWTPRQRDTLHNEEAQVGSGAPETEDGGLLKQCVSIVSRLWIQPASFTRDVGNLLVARHLCGSLCCFTVLEICDDMEMRRRPVGWGHDQRRRSDGCTTKEEALAEEEGKLATLIAQTPHAYVDSHPLNSKDKNMRGLLSHAVRTFNLRIVVEG